MTSEPVSSRASVAAGRALWSDVVARRKEWARQAGPGHFEGLPASERVRWLGELDDALVVLEDAVHGRNDVDPRAAAVDVMAVCAAWIEQMG